MLEIGTNIKTPSLLQQMFATYSEISVKPIIIET